MTEKKELSPWSPTRWAQIIGLDRIVPRVVGLLRSLPGRMLDGWIPKDTNNEDEGISR